MRDCAVFARPSGRSDTDIFRVSTVGFLGVASIPKLHRQEIEGNRDCFVNVL